MGYTGNKKREYQLKWCMDRKAEYLKNKTCHFCHADQNIEIHHVDPSKKESSRIWSLSDERIRAELEKCIYLCEPCHKKLHAIMLMRPLIHGTRYAYEKYKCRCLACREAKARENAETNERCRPPKIFGDTELNTRLLTRRELIEINQTGQPSGYFMAKYGIPEAIVDRIRDMPYIP